MLAAQICSPAIAQFTLFLLQRPHQNKHNFFSVQFYSEQVLNFAKYFQLRTVKLRRTSNGSLGISIKGGKDNNLPILVSKVCRDEDDDHLYIGDAIVKGIY